MDAVAGRVREHLAHGPRRASEVQGLLLAEGYPRIAAVGIGMWTDIVRIPPSGTWEHRRADLYGLADHWLGPSDVTETVGEHLVRRYLGGFGPASLKDLVSWSGLPTAKLRSVLERVRLRRFRDEHGGELLDVPRAPLPDSDTPAPVRFLPTWDATLLAHARRSQILPEAYRSRVFSTRTPHSIGRSSSTARLRAGGIIRAAACGSSRSRVCLGRSGGRSKRKGSGWPRSTVTETLCSELVRDVGPGDRLQARSDGAELHLAEPAREVLSDAPQVSPGGPFQLPAPGFGEARQRHPAVFRIRLPLDQSFRHESIDGPRQAAWG
jgi:hypothetical protein